MSHTRPVYPPEFRAEAVDLVRRSDKSLATLAKDLGVADQTLRNWCGRPRSTAASATG